VSFSLHKGGRIRDEHPTTVQKTDTPPFIDSIEGNIMNKLIKALGIFVVLPLLVVSCNLQAIQARPEEQATPKIVPYEALLGKSLNDKEVADFIISNNCSSADWFQICKDIGMALWTDSDQIVKTIYLYSGDANGFKRYRGELPFGLTFYDPMWRVEEKLMDLDTDDPLQQLGLPEEGSSPDHMHYWAVYRRFGMTVVYNSPAADEDAYIYAVLVSK
jgi:hypothetical protein